MRLSVLLAQVRFACRVCRKAREFGVLGFGVERQPVPLEPRHRRKTARYQDAADQNGDRHDVFG